MTRPRMDRESIFNARDSGRPGTGCLTLIQLSPVLISALLLAAHFLRTGSRYLVVISLAFPLLLLVRRALAARLVQAVLVLAALEWVRTMVLLAELRSDMGLPRFRMTILLGAVAVFTFGSLFVFLSKTLRTRYNLLRVE